MRVRIPADVDREDRLLAGLTARQLVLLAVPAMALWGIYLATRGLIPAGAFAVVAGPIAAACLALVIGQRDGLSFDRLVVAAIRQRRAGHHLVPAPEGVLPLPAWAPTREPPPLPGPLDVPWQGLDSSGVLDLGAHGSALMCQASPVNLGLRSDAEQEALVAGFGRFLNAIAGSMQIVVRSERADMRSAVAALEADAGGLPHPALEAAAREHATFLAELAARRDVFRRSFLLVFAEPSSPAEAASTLQRRAEDAIGALAAVGVIANVLDGSAARRTLAGAAQPDALSSLTDTVRAGDVIRGRQP